MASTQSNQSHFRTEISALAGIPPQLLLVLHTHIPRTHAEAKLGVGEGRRGAICELQDLWEERDSGFMRTCRC